MKTLSTACVGFILLPLVVSGGSQAQSCVSTDDGFDLGCCTVAAPTIPPFPAKSLFATYGRLIGCTPNTANVAVTLSPPSFLLCDFALVQVNATFLGSNDTITGTLFAKYSRTWLDSTTSSGITQIWRLLVNGDLTCTPGSATTPCASSLPSCSFASPGYPVHFDGHIDYQCDPNTAGNYFVSFSLNHFQGCISHAPWSCSPLSGITAHDHASYHLVGPAPFTFLSGAPAPSGAMFGDAVRASQLHLTPAPAVYQCYSEAKTDPLVSGMATSSSAGCSCASINPCTSLAIPCSSTGCYENVSPLGLVCCPIPGTNTFTPLPVSGTPVAATGMIALKLGSWSGQPNYPYSANLTIYFGVLQYQDPCFLANWNLHVVTGVGTSNVVCMTYNSSASPCSLAGLQTQAAIDLQNVLPLNNPSLPPGYGCLAASDVVWNLNVF